MTEKLYLIVFICLLIMLNRFNTYWPLVFLCPLFVHIFYSTLYYRDNIFLISLKILLYVYSNPLSPLSQFAVFSLEFSFAF